MSRWTCTAAQGLHVMRHEDHVGHKVDWVDGEGLDITPTNTASPTASASQEKRPRLGHTGVRCRFLAKVHQGVSTPDAFTNNLHEVMYFGNWSIAIRATTRKSASRR